MITAADVFVYLGNLFRVLKEAVDLISRSCSSHTCSQAYAQPILNCSGIIIFTIEALEPYLNVSRIVNTLEGHQSVDTSAYFSLQTSGRYAHSKEYILKTTKSLPGVSIEHMEEVVLRENNGVDVKGYIVSLSVNA